MYIIVGRKGNQPFAITDKSVSGKHLKVIPLENGTVQIEDIGSSNGTFVNGQKIIRKIVSINTIVTLGGSYKLRISDVIPKKSNTNTSNLDATKPTQKEEGTIDISHLEKVWDRYNEKKKTILKDNASKQFARMLPMTVIGLVGVLISFIPGLGTIRFVVTSVIVLIAGIVIFKAKDSQTDLPIKMLELDDNVKIDYICPKCKNFLGILPYENIKNRGCCPYCKTKWKK